MPYVTVGQENSAPIELYYEDHGSGRPVVLIHGFPLNGRAWERQARALLGAGFRVITYDRRGFGRSSQPVIGYNYDTFAADLDKLLTALDLHDVCLAGHSMGGGEIARYLGKYGSGRVQRAVIVSGVPPYLLKTPETPNGVPQEVFDQIAAGLTADRAAYFTEWNKNFFNLDETLGTLISAEVVQDAWLSRASARRAAQWLEARGLAYPERRKPPADQSVRRGAGHRSVRAGIRRGRGRGHERHVVERRHAIERTSGPVSNLVRAARRTGEPDRPAGEQRRPRCV